MPVLPLTSICTLDRGQLGGKAAGIVRMRQLGVPTPPAFVITTDECGRFLDGGSILPGDVVQSLPEAIEFVESETGMTFGNGERPLLVSVRSGAAVSMPGMMDTILNLGINASVEKALASLTADATFARDVHQRFRAQFEEIVGCAVPGNPMDQLRLAVAAVFASWNSGRAVAYRKDRKLTDSGGTAVTVQAMVFGNLDDQSGSGVLFTRNPFSGGPEPFGEWLRNGQGEDVVSGRFDPSPIGDLERRMPSVYDELLSHARTLEREQRDVQDIEFTIQSGKLWLLQTRQAKRSAGAALRLATLLAREGVIGKREALKRVSKADVAMLRRPHINPNARATATPLAAGHAVSPGVGAGIAVTDTLEAEDRAIAGEDIVLVRRTTSPDDVRAMAVVNGIATEIGGSTSHAAVVSRELNVPCVVGCGADNLTGLAGKAVTVDGDNGEVLLGMLRVVKGGAEHDSDLNLLRAWAESAPKDDQAAVELWTALRALPNTQASTGGRPRNSADLSSSVRGDEKI